MSDEEIIEVVSALKANDKTMKDSGISDNLWGKAVECIMFLQSENAALRDRLEKSVEHGKYFIIEEPRNGKIYYSILRHKVINNYICTELTREAALARLAELKGESHEQ